MAGRMCGLLERLLARRRETARDGAPDDELLRQFARARDEAAFEFLVWRHGSMVLGVCRRAIRDEQLAEDAFQAVFLFLAQNAGAVRGNLGGWLFRVARRVAAHALSRRPNVQPVVETVAPPVPDPVESDELAALLDNEVARLPERLRRPVVLCYLGDRTTEDAARELGCKRGTVLSRLATARGLLKSRLTRRGVKPVAAVVVSVTVASNVLAALVRQTVPLALALRNGQPVGVNRSVILAEEVLKAMKTTKLFAMSGVALLAVSVVSGFGLVVAQNPTPTPTERSVKATVTPAPVQSAGAPVAAPSADPPAKPAPAAPTEPKPTGPASTNPVVLTGDQLEAHRLLCEKPWFVQQPDGREVTFVVLGAKKDELEIEVAVKGGGRWRGQYHPILRRAVLQEGKVLLTLSDGVGKIVFENGDIQTILHSRMLGK